MPFEQYHSDFLTEKGFNETEISKLAEREDSEKLKKQIDRYKENLEKANSKVETQEQADNSLDFLEIRVVESIKDGNKTLDQKLKSLTDFMEDSIISVEDFLETKKSELNQKVMDKIKDIPFIGDFVGSIFEWSQKEDKGWMNKMLGGAKKSIGTRILGYLGLKGFQDEIDNFLASPETIKAKLEEEKKATQERIKPVGELRIESEEKEDEQVKGANEELSSEKIDKRKGAYNLTSYKILELFSGNSVEANKLLGGLVEELKDKNFSYIQKVYLDFIESDRGEKEYSKLLSVLDIKDSYNLEQKNKIIDSIDNLVGANANLMIQSQLGDGKMQKLLESPKFIDRFGKEYKENIVNNGLEGLSLSQVLVLFSYSLPSKMISSITGAGNYLKQAMFEGVEFSKEILSDIEKDRQDIISDDLLKVLLSKAKDSSLVLDTTDKYKETLLEGESNLSDDDLDKMDKFIDFKNKFIGSIKEDKNITGFGNFENIFNKGIDGNELVLAYLAFNGNANIDTYSSMEKLSLYYWLSGVLKINNENRAFITYLGRKIIESHSEDKSNMFSEEESVFILSNFIKYSRDLFDIALSPGSWGRNMIMDSLASTKGESLSEYEYIMIGIVIGAPVAVAGSLVFGPFVRIAASGVALFGVSMLLSKLNDEGTLAKALANGSGLDERKKNILKEIIEKEKITIKN